MSLTEQFRGLSLTEICQKAITALDEGLRASPESQAEPIARAERAINQLRDELIERLRRNSAEKDPAPWRGNLDEVNISLSLVAGVEFPAGAIHQKKLKQARKMLRKVEKSLPDLELSRSEA